MSNPKPCDPSDQATTPNYLGPHDHPWLLALIETYERFAGRRSAELTTHLREPFRVDCPADRFELARRVMDRICKSRTGAAFPPRKAREAVFCAAAPRIPRESALRIASTATGVAPAVLHEAMFADLPGERLIPLVPADLQPAALVLHANLALVNGMLTRATKVRITLRGNARDVVRSAQLRGLLCVVHGAPSDETVVLEISGPLSLFRRTRVYGRALASLVPRLMHCDHFELRADCLFDDRRQVVCVRSGDPIFPSEPPRRFDSKLEERFARDFAKLALDWDLIREPSPIAADGTLIFPDFKIVHRRDPARRAWLEIIGFWMPGYLTDKLRRLRHAGLGDLIVCIDSNLNCGVGELPENARLVRFKRRIDPNAVLAALGG